jgi:hypothetical protein
LLPAVVALAAALSQAEAWLAEVVVVEEEILAEVYGILAEQAGLVKDLKAVQVSTFFLQIGKEVAEVAEVAKGIKATVANGAATAAQE